MTEYDFQNPIVEEKENVGDDFINQKTEDLKSKINKNRKVSNSGGSWLLVFVLMITLAGLGTFSLIQIREKDQEIAGLKEQSGQDLDQKSVAGVNEIKEKTRVSGDNFTIIVENQRIPDGYEIEDQVVNFPYLLNKTAVTTSFLAKVEGSVVGEYLKSGIEVTVSEYDNILDKKAFNQKVLAELGSGYEITSDNVITPKGIALSKIENLQENGIEYFTAVTNQNYYLIKLYNETSNNPDLAEYSRFAEKLIEGIYLN